MLELRKSEPVRLRTLGLDEKWLQDRISEDPSLLGLGDLHIIQRERSQPTGGRIDFLMYNPEAETRYEIEIMLGAVDESHIIRTIEYWDVERQRYPALDHRAVIVAEEITSRFFNVIRLLNRAVPLVAIQLSAFRFDNSVVLHFTKVLDVYEFGDDADDEVPAEQADRAYWEKRANSKSLAIVDQVTALVPAQDDSLRVTYNKGHIAVGTTGRNFCWFFPRGTASHCNIQIRTGGDSRDKTIEQFDESGISAGAHRAHSVKLKLVAKDLEANSELLGAILKESEELSRGVRGG